LYDLFGLPPWLYSCELAGHWLGQATLGEAMTGQMLSILMLAGTAGGFVVPYIAGASPLPPPPPLLASDINSNAQRRRSRGLAMRLICAWRTAGQLLGGSLAAYGGAAAMMQLLLYCTVCSVGVLALTVANLPAKAGQKRD